ncbi:ABC transporter permease [Candidatus Protochlamydia phocaeensis]|uniref:ABC transporter permease n=1 Tax=Candidatus Protochlamydia phocaeensis TaxID=1414722 RepID=UPI000838AEA0|nr:ABC transporter permease [Candidatus Protochlamydia phocaeensis]
MPRVSPLIFLKMAFISLRRHPIRSGLALLGIVIGIASMTVTMAIGEGASERLKKEILAMGENWIYIVPGNFLSRGEVRKRKQKKNLTYEDYLAMRQFSSSIQACTPCVEKKEEINYQGNQLVAEIQGVNADFFRIEPRGIKKGTSFSAHHDKAAIPVVVLGSDVAKELFKQEDPVGKTVRIAARPFQVIGVFNEAPKRMNRIQNPNINAVVPFSSVWRKMIASEEGNHSIQEIIVRPKDGTHSAQLVAGVRRLIRFQHKIPEGEPDDFTIWDLQAMMQAAHKSSQAFNQFLLVAASVSLVVGGIGIMNIMLVAMTERKKEIGIKMAIGATAGHILFQFLIESILLCLSGGVVGILFGIGGASLLGAFTDFDWALRTEPIILAFLTTAAVGLFFGFYPAYKASRLNPIEALQSI